MVPIDLIETVSQVLERYPGIDAAYMYGSAAAGRGGKLSDVDIALVANEIPLEHRGSLLRELALALGRAYPHSPFDLRFLDELPVAIRGRVVAGGRCILERNAARRVEAEVRARMDYHDFQHFEREGAREGLRGLRKAVRDG